jgi:hypothetical protein
MKNLSGNLFSSVTSLGNVYGHRKCRKIDLFNVAATGRIQNQKDPCRSSEDFVLTIDKGYGWTLEFTRYNLKSRP